MDLSVEEIDRSHRVGRLVNDRPRPIIVKFISYRKRSEVFRNKKQLKGTGITVREDLTKRRHNLLKQCIEKHGVTNVWTLDGNVILKDGENKRRIMHEADI